MTHVCNIMLHIKAGVQGLEKQDFYVSIILFYFIF